MSATHSAAPPTQTSTNHSARASAVPASAETSALSSTQAESFVLQRTLGNRRLAGSGNSTPTSQRNATLRTSMDAIVQRAARFAPTVQKRTAVQIQRHNMPIPKAIAPTQLRAPKQVWNAVEGATPIISAAELTQLRAAVAAQMPPGGNPTPQQRADAVVVETVDTAGMPAGYQQAQIPAKADTNGKVWINRECIDYFKPDGSPDGEKVKSTVVHEFMHAASASHKGLQDYAGLLNPTGAVADSRMQPDEAITDMLAVRAYEAVFGVDTAYKTGYWVQSSGSVQAYTDGAKKALAATNSLPVAWTGDMVEVLMNVLGKSEQELIGAYFTDPNLFGQWLGQANPGAPVDAAIKARMIKEWNTKIGMKGLENQGVLTMGPQGQNNKDELLLDVVTLPIAKRFVAAGNDRAAQVAVMRKALAQRDVPLQAQPGAIGPSQFTYTDAYFSPQRLGNIRQKADSLILNAPAPRGPALEVTTPAEQAIVNPGMMTVNAKSPTATQVKAKYGTRDWQPMLKVAGNWTTQVAIPAAPLNVETMLEISAVSATYEETAISRTLNIGGRPPVEPGPALDQNLVTDHLQKLGVPADVVKIIIVPYSKPAPTVGNAAARMTFKLNTPFSQYPADYLFNLAPGDMNESLFTWMPVDKNQAGTPAAQFLNEHFNGGGYDDDEKIVVLSADHNQPRTLLHELGHYKQDIGGSTENNSYVMVLEYHNVLLNENLDPAELRTSYGSSVPVTPNGKTWVDLRNDVTDYPQTLQLLNEIETALATPKYAALAAQIKDNLVAEYFTDQKGDKAAKKSEAARRMPNDAKPVIDFPQDGATITGNHYSVRVTPPPGADNVRVKINKENFDQARHPDQHWYYDFNPADFPAGKMLIKVEAWNPAGQRSEATRKVKRG